MGGDPQDRPARGADVPDHVLAEHLEQLVAQPVGDLVIGPHVLGAHKVDDQRLRVADAQGVVAEDAQPDGEVGLGVDHVVDQAAEGQAGKLAGGDEVELALEVVAARLGVDQAAQEGDLAGAKGRNAGRDRAHHLAVAEEDRRLVLLDRQLRQVPDVGVRPLVDELVFVLVGQGDELAFNVAVEEVHFGGVITRACAISVVTQAIEVQMAEAA